jgi:predicted AAA+ superfamily ATPase
MLNMKYVKRTIEKEMVRAAKSFPAIILTGPRRAGKTTLLVKIFPNCSYHLLEDPEVISRIRSDPRSFLGEIKMPAILDEVQNTPEILNYIRAQIDRSPRRMGQWFLTGSQDAPLMQGVTESMAGRAAIFNLLPFSASENQKVSLIRGGFPEVLARPSTARIWFASYVQTYLERDVRAVSSIRDLSTFRRFLSILASRCGNILNRTDIAAPLGVSVPTISEWLSILEITGQIIMVPPYFENFGKRLIKSPKIYFVDSGLLAHLLGIASEAMLNRSPFLGPVFETFVASEILKAQINSGRPKALYYFRDQQGLEVDFVIPRKGRGLLLVEAKASKTVIPQMADSLVRLSNAVSDYDVECVVLHRPSKEGPGFSSLRPGVKALTMEGFLERFRSRF